MIYYLVAFIFISGMIKIYYNSYNIHWLRYSKSISESKKNNVFLETYKLSKIEFDNDSTQYQSSFNDLVVWKEKEWGRPPFLIFFHPLRITGKDVLIIKNPTDFDNDYIFFESYSGSHRANKGYSIIQMVEKEFSDKVVLRFNVKKHISGILELEKD